ncbi:hypothetical protein WJX72_007110 [[Myrmecia] bisecta]|uniref:Beta-hexosaminidase n=1 Tax=[Myrmecia] bisecta TaxID=41462 RepID=A0AAW1P664_9CHLO
MSKAGRLTCRAGIQEYPEWTLDQIAGLVFGALMLASAAFAAQADALVAQSQRKELGLCPACGGVTNSTLCALDPKTFQFVSKGSDSRILKSAFDRYTKLIFETPSAQPASAARTLRQHAQQHGAELVKALEVTVHSVDQSLDLATDESYNLTVHAPTATLSANSVYGALRGLETFSQLIDRLDDPDTHMAQPGLLAGDTMLGCIWEAALDALSGWSKGQHPGGVAAQKAAFVVNGTVVRDAPRFHHRGLLLDTSRHFLPVPTVLEHLDAMAWSKMNVFHWHIVDDQSFPYVSSALPLLAELGAFSPRHTYSPADVQSVIMAARERGIRVIPEFDTPGHTLSWGKAHPEVLTQCYGKDGQPTGELGPMNPIRNETYGLVWELLREAAQVFPDSYVHLGGDEVPFDCWESNPDIKDWMAANKFKAMRETEEYFEGRVLELAAAAGRSYIVWQEILDNGVKVKNDTVVHVWKWWEDGRQLGHETGNAAGARHHHPKPATCALHQGCRPEGAPANDASAYLKEMARITEQGYRVLLSSPWYLNLGSYDAEEWAQYYAVDPLGFEGSAAQHALVMGGEACMWGEKVDATNAVPRIWPRAAAIAERLWSPANVTDIPAARARLVEHRCRMLSRGLRAQPMGPGFCPADLQ